MGEKSKEIYMNVHVIKDKENNNYLTNTNRWSPLMYKAKIFTSVATAKTKRANISKKANKKLHVETYELTYLGET
jgi:hypothetical protein